MALLLKADRDTYGIRGDIGELARSSGGRYLPKEAAWDFNANQEAFNRAEELKAIEAGKRQLNLTDAITNPTNQQLPTRASTNTLIENDKQIFIIENDPIVDKLLASANETHDTPITFAAASSIIAERFDGSLLFSNEAEYQNALSQYDVILRKERNSRIQTAMQQTPGVNVSHEATFVIQDQMRALGGKWTRTEMGGFWNFSDPEKGARAQALLDEFIAQPPSIVDLNAIYCRRELKGLGWFDKSVGEHGAWKFPNDENLAKANALVIEARALKPNGDLERNIFLAASLGAGTEVFGFDPNTQPERLAYLDRHSAVEALKTAKTFLAEREIDLDREIRNALSHPTVRAANEIVSGAAAKAALPGDKPRRSPGNYEAEHDESAIIRVTGQEGAALLRSVREQLATTGISTGSLKLNLASPDTSQAYTVGPIVGASPHYLIQRVDGKDERGLATIGYAIHERGRIQGRIATNDDIINKAITELTVVAVANKSGHLFVKNVNANDPSEIERNTKDFLATVKTVSVEGTLDLSHVARDEQERSALLAGALPQLQSSRNELAAARERAHIARQQQAERESQSFVDTLHMPPPLELVTSHEYSNVVHGKIVGDYGQKQERAAGKNYRAPVSKNYIAVQHIDRPNDITIFDTRQCDTAFGSEVAMRRKFADSALPVSVGWADGNLVVATGFLNQQQLSNRRDYWLSQPQKERAVRAETGPELEAGTYENILRNDLEFAQRHGRELLARKLGRDLSEIKVHLSNRGQEPSTDQILQFAGVGAHAIVPTANETIGANHGAEVLLQTKFHSVLHMKEGIRIGDRNRIHEQVVALSRADLYLHDKQREPEVSERVVVSFESGILKSCELYTGQERAREAAASILADARSVPNYTSSQDREVERTANEARLAISIAARRGLIVDPEQSRHAKNVDQLDFVKVSNDGLYKGQVFGLKETLALEYPDQAFPNADRFYVQLISRDDYVIHERDKIDAPIHQGSSTTITYRGGKPYRTGDEVTLDDLKRGVVPGRADEAIVERPIGRETNDMGLGR